MGPYKNHPGIDKEYGVIHASETLPQRNPFEPQARNIKGRISTVASTLLVDSIRILAYWRIVH